MRLFVGGLGLVAVLGCAGLTGTPEPEEAPPPPDGPARVERSGEVVPAKLAEWSWDGRCHLRQRTIGAEAAPVEVTDVGLPCPFSAFLTWTDQALIYGDEAGVMFDAATGGLDDPPDRIQLAVLDGDTLHACGKVDVPIARHGSDLDAEYHGKKLLGYFPAIGQEAEVAVHWVLGEDGWKEQSAEIVIQLMLDPPGFPACRGMADLPKGTHYALSSGVEWTGTDWTPAIPEDQEALAALSAGDWTVDATRTVAARGQPGGGPYAVWGTGAWQLVYPGTDATGLWVLDDHLAVRDGGGGLTLFSRRDGSVAFTQADKTLAMPWPNGAPIPARSVPGDGGEDYVPGVRRPKGGERGGDKAKSGKGERGEKAKSGKGKGR